MTSRVAPLAFITPYGLRQIISLEDVHVDASSDTLYIVMELMECDLHRVLASRQVLTVDHVKVLLKQLLLGVQAMHSHGIIRAYTLRHSLAYRYRNSAPVYICASYVVCSSFLYRFISLRSSIRRNFHTLRPSGKLITSCLVGVPPWH